MVSLHFRLLWRLYKWCQVELTHLKQSFRTPPQDWKQNCRLIKPHPSFLWHLWFYIASGPLSTSGAWQSSETCQDSKPVDQAQLGYQFDDLHYFLAREELTSSIFFRFMATHGETRPGGLTVQISIRIHRAELYLCMRMTIPNTPSIQAELQYS